MSASLSDLVDNMSGIFNSIKCKSCMEKIKINLECCFVGLKSNRLILRCREYKEKYKRPIEGLIRKLPSMYQFCNGDLNKFILLLRKGVYPDEDMDNWEKFHETTIPPQQSFYSELNLENITDSDTLLLENVFQIFRDKCNEIYEFDPVYFVSAPGLV